jgi:hypothetical protein
MQFPLTYLFRHFYFATFTVLERREKKRVKHFSSGEMNFLYSQAKKKKRKKNIFPE